MIELMNLTKRYGPVTALDSLSLSIREGETFGLLGPNGAGKTTTLRLLAGLTQATSGSARVLGKDPWASPVEVRRALGVLPDGAGIYERLTVRQNLRLFAGLFAAAPERIEEVMALTGILDLKGRLAGKLSKGQRQRLALARAILHSPSILVLDEPTAGLDPIATAQFHDLLRRLSRQGTTIILSSHDMAEVEALCDRVAVLSRGQLMGCDTVANLKAAFGPTMAEVYIHLAGRELA